MSTMTCLFPHSCRYCRKYYSYNDRNNAIGGGGECWTWSAVKGGDRCVNSCEQFEPVDELCLLQRAMYSVRASACDGNAFRFVFGDAFSHVDFLVFESDSVSSGLHGVRNFINGAVEYIGRCSSLLSRFLAGKSKPKTMPSRNEKCNDDTIINPHSTLRRKLNTMLRGFSRNMQFDYRLSPEQGGLNLKVRLYNKEGDPEFRVFSDRLGKFVPLEEYCGLEPVHGGFLASAISDDFGEYAKFLGTIRREIDNHDKSDKKRVAV